MTQVDLLQLGIKLLEEQGIPYMLVGSFASGVYGDIRFTNDIDIVVGFQPSQLEKFCNSFSIDDGFYVSLAAARDALQRGGQFNILHTLSNNKIDVMMIPRNAWGQSQFQRRRREIIIPPSLTGYIAAPEDVILGKLWYYRDGEHEKHLRDIVTMLREDRGIDREYLNRWIAQLGYGDLWELIEQRLKIPPKDAPRG